MAALVVATASVVLLIAIGAGNVLSTQQSETEPAPVVAAVETGAVEDTLTVPVRAVPAFTLEIPSTQFGSGIVTAAAPAEGTALDEGDVLVTVNESPVIVIEGMIPAYRSLGKDSQGKDVEQLQEYLRRSGHSVGVDGIFGASTAAALAEMYESRGYPVVTADGAVASDRRDAGLPQSGYVFVASTPVLVGGECGRAGQSVDALTCVLRSQKSTLVISDSSGQSLTGLSVRLASTSGSELTAAVGAGAAPVVDTPTTESTAAGEDSRQWYSLDAVPAEVYTDPPEDARVVVSTSPADGLRVPATAVREAADGATYIRGIASGQGSPARGADYSVEVVLCAGGYCAIRGDGVVAGMRIELLG